jgi:hypothetical protein
VARMEQVADHVDVHACRLSHEASGDEKGAQP